MEKYNVQLDDEKTKTASDKPTCPKCGSELYKPSQGIPQCPKCGTEPFEKREKK